MAVKQLKEYLEKNHVNFTVINHSPAYTSQEIAEAAHVSGKQLAKTVIIKVKGKLAMAVLPSNEHVNFATLREVTGSSKVELAAESEFKNKFTECELGAMPPFGNLYGLPVYVSAHLRDYPSIIFNAGSHSELMQMSYVDFEKLVKPSLLAAA